MDRCIRKSQAYQKIVSDIRADKLTHAYMFVAEDPEYLRRLAKLVAKLIMCKNVKKDNFCDVCKDCTKIEKNIHSDVTVFGETGKIVVDDTKKFLESVNVLPFESDRKVYIFHGIEDTNDASQNKILKTLEEPPADTFIIMTTSNEYKVLQTIKSRSKKIYAGGLTTTMLEEELRSRGIKNPELTAIEACGNLSVALALADSSYGAESVYSLVTETFKNFKKAAQLVEFTSKFESNKKNLTYILDLFTIFARDMIFMNSGAEEKVLNVYKRYDIISLSGEFSNEALLGIIDAVLDAKKRLVYNVSLQNVIDTFLLKFLEVRIKCKKLLA